MSSLRSVAVTIPGGYWRHNAYRREACLRSLTGDDEIFLLELGDVLLPAERTTWLLARCLTWLDAAESVSPEAVRSLTVGDREALLLHLRRLTFGNRIRCILTCPSPACGELMDVDLAVSDLVLPPYVSVQERYDNTFTEDECRYRVRFHLPTGGDQEIAARLARLDLRAGAAMLARRCVDSVIEGDNEGNPIEDLPPGVVSQLSTKMAELDPQAEIVLNLTCPACGHYFSALFDTAAYLFREVSDRMAHLYHEVHLLALQYHWSEVEILGMPSPRRARYLEMLAGGREAWATSY